MSKLVLSIFAVFTLLFAFSPVARAEELFGFMDGKVYDSTATLKYICFMDSKCYDLNGVYSFSKVTAGAPVTDKFKTECSDPLTEFKTEMATLKAEYNTKYQYIMANSEGKTTSALAADVQALDRIYSPKLEDIEDDRNDLATDCHEEYPNNVLPNLY